MIADFSPKIKLWSSDPFRNANVMNEDRRQIARFNNVNSEIVGRKFTKFVPDVAELLPLNLLKAIYDRPIRCRTPKQRIKVVPRDVCEHLPNLTGCHSNVPWATAKRIVIA